MAQYDEGILRKFADRMYARANSMIAAWVVLGLIVGGGVGVMVGNAYRSFGSNTSIGVISIIGGLIGLIIGMEKAFHLKLEAQEVLCELQVEINTRKSSG